MLHTQDKSLIIVHDTETNSCAEFLQGLIGELSANGMPINAVVVHKKQFASYPAEQKSAKQKILYIGDFTEGKVLEKNILNWQYDKFGIRYGWLGNKGLITFDSISESDFIDMAEYAENELKDYQLNMQENVDKRGINPIKQLKKIPKKVKKLSLFGKVALGVGALFSPVLIAGAGAVDGIVSMAKNKDNQPLSHQLFDTVKAPTGGTTVFTVPSISGDEIQKELVGIILDYSTPRAYWDSADPVEGVPPVCCRSRDINSQ